MPRIYAPNESHNTEYGADFINGVAAVAYNDANILAYFDGKGYTEVQGGDVLQAFDYLTRTDLDRIALSMDIDTSVPVTTWVDTDTYDAEAAASYTLYNFCHCNC